jgi:BMFP domain-containing protein YqiC
MVERAMPPFIEDPAEQRIAEEAAESGIRQTTRLAGIAGGILFVVMAAMLYMYLPSQQISLAPSESTRAAPEPEAENDANLHQPSEDMLGKLDGVTKERDTLQGKLTVLEGQVAELTSKLQAAKALAAPKVTPQPAKQATGPARAPVLASRPGTYQCGDGRTVRNPAACKPANASAPGVLPSPPGTYQCGDGRTVRNPAECKPAAGAAPGG